MANDPRFEVFPQRDENRGSTDAGLDTEFYWRLRAANGRIVATGGEGFEDSNGAVHAIGDFLRTVFLAAPEIAKALPPKVEVYVHKVEPASTVVVDYVTVE